MKRKMILVAALLLAAVFTAYSQQYDSESDFTVETINGGKAVRITGYAGKNTEVRIPPRIRNLPVTEIGKRAFGDKGLTSVIIPNGVISIGDLAFIENRLNSVTIPNTVTIIMPAAFAANRLNSVIIPNSVREIGESAFQANNISEITIGSNITIYSDTFDNGFVEFYSASGRIGKTYKRNSGFWCDFFENGFAVITLNNEKSVQIIGYSGTNTNIQIPSLINNLPVTSIGNGAFGRKRLDSVVIPNSVTTISSNAFFGSVINKITIGANVTFEDGASGSRLAAIYIAAGRKAVTYNYTENIGWYEFIENGFACVTLSDGKSVMITGYSGTDKSLQIPAQLRNLPVTKIYNGVFNNKGLTSVNIPNSVTSIGVLAFRNNKQLTSITIPNNVTIEENNAFENYFDSFYKYTGYRAGTYYYKENLAWYNFIENDFGGLILNDGKAVMITGYTGTNKAISIPAQMRNLPVTEIRSSAFSKKDLTSVTIPNSVTSIGISAFANNNLTSVTIPNSVTSIGDNAFSTNKQLTSVTIGNGVISIGEGAFSFCDSLTSVTIPNSVTSIGGGAFYGCSRLTSVTIPNSVTSIERETFSGCTNLASVTFAGTITENNFGSKYGDVIVSPFYGLGDLRTKYLATGGGIGTYTTIAPVSDRSVWTKR